MQVGCLGELIFSVSDSLVQTLSNMQWSGSARYATHQRHLKDALTEFAGWSRTKSALTWCYPLFGCGAAGGA